MKHPIRSVGIRHLDWIGLIKATDMPPFAKLLAHTLATFMNKDQDMAWPSITRLEAETSMSRKSVCRHMETLESEGWLIRERGKPGKNTRYIIGFPKAIEDTLARVTATLPSITGSVTETPTSVTVTPKVVSQRHTNQQVNQPKNNKGGRFTPPSLQEVTRYCQERKNTIDPERFIDFYEASGWMRGKNKIKDWKACVRTWEKNGAEKTNNIPNGQCGRILNA